MDRKYNPLAQQYDETIYGIDTIKEGHKVAFLANLKTSTIIDEDVIERSVLSLYMLEPNGQIFHAYIKYSPYFYITCREDLLRDMMVYLERKFEKKLASVELVEKVDLDVINYLSGKMAKYIKLNFRTINDLMFVRNIIRNRYEQNKNKVEEFSFDDLLETRVQKTDDLLDQVTDMREYDVPYHIRVCIDKDIRASCWYSVSFKDHYIDEIKLLKDKTLKPELHVLAFDIETTKLPLKFPDAKFDQIMMISYVIDGDGYLITNREIISKDIEDFEYTPKPEYESQITVFNEPNEAGVIDRFFAHIREVKPMVIASYNGDFFDWPFVEARAKVHNMSMHQHIGVSKNNDEYYGRYITHMDCFCWVNRDSYLPQGSRGLKNVTKHKLGYNPIELDPERMLPLASEDPQLLSEYSVSDAIATYYLYKKHIHDFIYALCTIIPMFPDEVLRSGSGTLCENLLMAEAYKRNIIFPNKKKEEFEKFYKGHFLNMETYIGGKVECINSGVYRDDISTKFRLEPEGYHQLIRDADKILEFTIKHDLGMDKEDLTNYEEVRQGIVDKLEELSTVPEMYECKPLIYHLDVAAMYPNIILTNRLQPTAIVDDKFCSGCLFNKPESKCKRNLGWEWKGEYYPLTRGEYEQMKVQIEYEFLKKEENGKSFHQIPQEEQHAMIKKRAREQSQKIYKQIYVSKTEYKENTVCMRANSFYVDTIRDFRDRRYEFKNLVKVWKTKMQEFEAQGNNIQAQDAKGLSIMYESLQLAHKVILNSFYGYVMRRGARWYSMEMAAMVTHLGSNIIVDAKDLIDKIGKPLELDTDGIWCLLPKGFPENFSFNTKTGKKLKFSFPCSMLNVLIYDKYANPQYQSLADPRTLRYDIRQEMSVFFEVDGPYKAMIIPAAREEGKQLKKRYAVYNFDGSIAEIKGFELKRRGELKLVKIFQEDLFNHFMEGSTLEECYNACGTVADRWLDILFKKGQGLDDEELLEYIGESKTLSKELEEYGKQKGVALTAAKRMAEFLGNQLVQSKGLNCFFIISQKPVGLPVSERVIPVAIFSAEEAHRRKFLSKWLGGDVKETDMRNIIDWDYYIERLGSSIQKIITIPAALQKIKNPVPRVAHPDWLHKMVIDYDLKFEQKKINSFFSKKPQAEIMDVEDMLQPSQFPGNINPLNTSQNLGKVSHNKNVKKTPIRSFVSFSKGYNIENGSGEKSLNTSQLDSVVPAAGEGQLNASFAGTSQISGIESGGEKLHFDMDNDFENWLGYQKNLWRNRRVERLSGDGSRRKSGPKSRLVGMFRSNEEQVMTATWHILQICDSDTPGIFKLWCLLENGYLFSVRVRVNRTFYVNSTIQTNAPGFKSVKKRLPRNKKLMNLYERTMDEEEFINKFHSFDDLLTNPDYEGVYENKLPLDFKLISEVRAIAKLQRNKSKPYNGYASYIFDVDELQPVNHYDKLYLNNFDLPMLVVSQISLKGKIVWGVFNNQLNEHHFLIIEKNFSSVTNNYKKVVKDVLREGTEDGDDLLVKISVNSFEKDEHAMAYLEQLLQQLKERNRNIPYLVVLQTQYRLQRISLLGLRSINTSFPTLHLPAVDSSDITFSSLDWQVKGLKQLCYQYLYINEYLDELLSLCRYAQVPFCNIGHDRLNFITDVIYARILKNANAISWYSLTGNPEIGGGKGDDARELIPNDFLPSEVINSNLYLDYCVEIDLELLARNAICASDELKDMEKESSTAVDFGSFEEAVKGDGQKHSDERRLGDDLDETVVCRTAFRLVKFMADHWFSDVVNHSNENADRLLGNLHRWMCDEESKFYDIFLHRLLSTLMKKFFGFLLQKLKALGAYIIYANPSKIIISTGKYTVHEAENYSNFILKTVISYPLFRYLNLRPKKYWKVLLLKDQYNYGGFVEEEEKKLDFKWNISDYLPPQLSKQFFVTLADYINKVNKFMDKTFLEDFNDAGNRLELFMGKVVGYSKKYIGEILAYHLFEAVPKLNEYFKENQARAIEIQIRKFEAKQRKEDLANHDDNASDVDNEYEAEEEDDELQREADQEVLNWQFPQIMGRIPKLQNGPLELIKFLCHILSFNEEVMDEVIVLKRNCLRLLGISDFAAEAKYIEPCKQIVLKDIVCKSCSNVIDIDLFRDDVFRNKDFQCQVCGVKFDERRLETKIIKLIKQSVIFYQIQDLYCHKCKNAKSELLERTCRCSGSFIVREDTPAYNFKAEQRQLINSLEELATHCEFTLLQDYLMELRFERSLKF